MFYFVWFVVCVVVASLCVCLFAFECVCVELLFVV